MIAVTGGNGPIGKYLIPELLKQGKELRVLYSQSGEIDKNVTCIIGDVLDVTALETLMEDVEQVYHLDVIDTFQSKSRKQMYHYNIDGTANVVNSALGSGVKKILLSSSLQSLGDQSDQQLFDETAKWNDTRSASGFGWSMHLAEREIWRGISEGLQGLILHTGVIAGNPNDRSTSTEIMDYCMKMDRGYPVGKIHITDVEDLVNIMVQFMEGPHFNEQYIVHAGGLSYREFGEKIAQHFSRKPPMEKISYISLKNKAILRRFNLFKKHNRPMLTKSLAQVLSDPRSFSNQKILPHLSSGFIDIDVTIKRLCGLYNEQRELK